MDKQQGCEVIHGDLSVIENSKGDEHIGSRQFIGEYLRHLLVNQVIICDEGSPGGSSHENLESELAKSLTRKERRAESQSKGAKKKILIPPSLRRGPISHTTLLVK